MSITSKALVHHFTSARGTIDLRTRIQDVRRRDLQQAAYEVVVERGFGGATISSVATKLGMSRGTVYQYFPDKHVLFEAAVRYTNAQLSKHVIERMKTAHSPRERLNAIIGGTFATGLFEPETARFWLSYCSEVAIIPGFARLQTVLMGRMKSNLVHELRQLTTDDNASEIADVLSILFDGLWMRRGLDPSSISSERAIAMASLAVDLRLGGSRS